MDDDARSSAVEGQAGGVSCRWPGAQPDQSGFPDPENDLPLAEDAGEAVLAGGCFWCVEAVFRRLDGVARTECGYAGGSAETASYARVCGGDTGHAEAVRIVYRPEVISFGALLKVFFSVAHDPTQWMRQGNDAGSQYRSAVFWRDEPQRGMAEAYIEQLNLSGRFGSKIVTRLEPLEAFYPAEAEHQDYAARHPDAGYIRLVSTPKVEKLERWYAGQLHGTTE